MINEKFLQNASIKRKLMLAGLLTTAVALLSISLMLLARGWLEGRGKMVDALATYAEIIAANAAPAMLFDDRQAASDTLAALKAIPDIVSATLYDKNGAAFAVYPARSEIKPPAMPPGGYRFAGRELALSQPIIFKGDNLGTIYLQSDLRRLYVEILKDCLLIFGAALLAFLAAALLFTRLQRGIVGPIRNLAALMQTLSREQNYAIRAPAYGSDEVGVLAQVFNAMLAQIQARDNALESHRAHLEQEVAERTAKLTEAQRIAHLGNWEWDIAGNALEWSDEIYRIFGLAPQQFRANYEAFLDAVHPDDRGFVDACVREALDRMRPYSIDHRIVWPDGSVRYVHEQAEVCYSEDGRPVKMLGTVHDITERKRMEDKIRKLNEALEIKVQERTKQLLDAQQELLRKEKLALLGQVAGSVGHELRNPLGVISNAVYFLRTVLADADDTVREYLEIIDNEVAGSERIVSELLDSVRTKPPHPQLVQVRELLDATLRKCAIPERIAVRLNIPDALPPLQVDALQMQQVLHNLLVNGADATPGEGTLEVLAEEDRKTHKVRIDIKDSGVGITPENLDKLFQPLFTTKARGIGLGLVVVRNLIRANGGEVDVHSEVGKGSVFTLTLPT
jgi:PAS domain S-box-containing protein